MTIIKQLKYIRFEYEEERKSLLISTDENGEVEMPKHYLVSLMRFGIRVLTRPKRKKKA